MVNIFNLLIGVEAQKTIKKYKRFLLKYHNKVTLRYHIGKKNFEGPLAVNFRKKQPKELRYFRDFIKLLKKLNTLHIIFVILFILYIKFILFYAEFLMTFMRITVLRVKASNHQLHLVNILLTTELYYINDLNVVMGKVVLGKFESIPMYEIFISEIDLQLGHTKPGFFDHRYDGWHRSEGWTGTRIEPFYLTGHY